MPRALRFETDFGRNFVHQLARRCLDTETRVEIGDAGVERIAQRGELLLFERITDDVPTLAYSPA